MMKPSCQALVTRGWVCGVGARYEFEGKHYCKTHHPPTAQAKADAQQTIRNEEWLARNDAISKERQDAKANLAALRAFAHACLSLWPYRGIDDDGLEELAVQHGLLERITVTEPCNADDPSLPCRCSAGGGFSSDDRAEGVQCFRKTRRLLNCAPTKEQP